MLNEFAPAKLNLYLHITGRRADGYHDLDSLVAFAGVGDEVRLEPADAFEFAVEGPQAAFLKNEPLDGNLVVKAAKSLAALTGKKLDVKLTLIKNLPVASGIGGGSSDAAAGLRALARHWGLSPDDKRLFEAAAQHGQDVPVCLKIENNYITMTGTALAPALPHADIVMVNPSKGLPTPAVYKAYKESGAAFAPLAQLKEAPETLQVFIEELKGRTNSLYEPAKQLMPEIGTILTALESTPGCLIARMSGSGATCFGIYTDRAASRAAAAALLAAHPGWWVTPSFIPYQAMATPTA